MPPKKNDPFESNSEDFKNYPPEPNELDEKSIKQLKDAISKLKQQAKEPTMAELAAEGARLLEEESKVSGKQKPNRLTQPEKPKADLTQNPYLKARLQVLTGYKDWRKREIAEMESKGNINNPHYAQFLIEVLQAAGDSPSEELWNQARGMS